MTKSSSSQQGGGGDDMVEKKSYQGCLLLDSRLTIKRDAITGNGLYATSPIPTNTIVVIEDVIKDPKIRKDFFKNNLLVRVNQSEASLGSKQPGQTQQSWSLNYTYQNGSNKFFWPTIGLVNHSWKANTILIPSTDIMLRTKQKIVGLMTTTDIKEGEQLFINYHQLNTRQRKVALETRGIPNQQQIVQGPNGKDVIKKYTDTLTFLDEILRQNITVNAESLQTLKQYYTNFRNAEEEKLYGDRRLTFESFWILQKVMLFNDEVLKEIFTMDLHKMTNLSTYINFPFHMIYTIFTVPGVIQQILSRLSTKRQSSSRPTKRQSSSSLPPSISSRPTTQLPDLLRLLREQSKNSPGGKVKLFTMHSSNV
jgi:hypothetical protein